MSNRGNNREPGTSQFWNGSSWVSEGAFPEIYVDLTGDDSNDGLTPGTPVSTLRVALQIASYSSVPSEIFIGAGSFAPAGLEDPRLLAPAVTITGSAFVTLSAAVAVSAYNSTSRVITFSPSPGWTANEFVGKLIQWQSGPSGPYPSPLAASALISQNTTDTVTVTYPASLISTPAVGDVMTVVEPATRIIGATSVVGPRGAVANASITPLRLQPVYRQFKNVLFDGQSEEGIVFDGSFRMDAVTTTDYGQVYFVGSCWAGEGATRTGRGLTARNVVGRHPEVRCGPGRFVMYLVGGRYISEVGGITQWSGGFLQDSDVSFPHGCLCAIGGDMLTFSQSIAGRLLIDAGTTNSVVAERGNLYISSPITHQGTSQFCEAQQMGLITISRNPVITGSSAEMYAATGGQIRLNVDGATLGAATAGSTVAGGRVTRAAAVWAIGDAVCGAANIPRDLCNIYRVT